VLNIDYIKPIPEDKVLGGGIKDFGAFSEGFCFQVFTKIPKYVFDTKKEAQPSSGKSETWTICTDDIQSKSSLMNFLIKSKIQKQKAAGLQISSKSSIKPAPKKSSSKKAKTQTATLLNKASGPSVADLGKKPSKNAKPKDGKWIVLQDWSQCSLKCGGGEQTLQLICMPPEKGGKPCEGQPIRKRPCNPQPCPRLSPPISIKQSEGQYEQPIVKVMPLSNRPVRYDKCHLKENDILTIVGREGLDLAKELQTAKDFMKCDTNGKIPARIIMNSKTISIYKDENLTSILITFDLENTSLRRIAFDKSCFILQGKIKSQQAIVCGMTNDPGFTEEWDYDFSLFQNQCKEKRPTFTLKQDPAIKKKFRDKMLRIKQELIEEKAEKRRAQTQKDEEIVINKKVEKTQATAVLAMQKETKLELLLEKEETMREKDEVKELETQLKAEEKKKEVVMKTIKEKELEEQFNISKENAEMAIQKIKEEAKKAIIKKRIEIKQKIVQMRKKNERKKAAIKSKISSIKLSTAKQLQKYSKNGDMNRCFVPNSKPKKLADNDPNSNNIENKPWADQLTQIEVVCTAAYTTNVEKYLECKNPETYCYSCCESEFGPIHLSEREKCYNKRCNKQ